VGINSFTAPSKGESAKTSNVIRKILGRPHCRVKLPAERDGKRRRKKKRRIRGIRVRPPNREEGEKLENSSCGNGEST